MWLWFGLVGCEEPAPDPGLSLEQVTALVRPDVKERAGWAADVRSAIVAAGRTPDEANVCQVLAIIEQEFDDPIARQWDTPEDRITPAQLRHWMATVGFELLQEFDFSRAPTTRKPPGCRSAGSSSIRDQLVTCRRLLEAPVSSLSYVL